MNLSENQKKSLLSSISSPPCVVNKNYIIYMYNSITIHSLMTPSSSHHHHSFSRSPHDRHTSLAPIILYDPIFYSAPLLPTHSSALYRYRSTTTTTTTTKGRGRRRRKIKLISQKSQKSVEDLSKIMGPTTGTTTVVQTNAHH